MLSDFPTLDGPLSFLIMLGFLTAAAAGAAALVACLLAMAVPRWRQSSIRAFIFGLIVGLIEAGGIGVPALMMPQSDLRSALLTAWLPLATLAGFGFGAGMALPSRRRTIAG